jgi:hypothetical protein
MDETDVVWREIVCAAAREIANVGALRTIGDLPGPIVIAGVVAIRRCETRAIPGGATLLGWGNECARAIGPGAKPPRAISGDLVVAGLGPLTVVSAGSDRFGG